jgi:FkbM family methyltransferase
LVEPAKNWHAALLKNRRAAIDKRCVWRNSGERLDFVETEYGELSTLVEFKDKDNNKSGHQAGKTYSVETVSLNDLLAKYNSPSHIDYLSIDTEGSELDILSAFNFSRYAIDIMTVEHNYTEDRSKIRSLLASNGFVNVFEAISNFDDWFLHQTFLQKLQA